MVKNEFKKNGFSLYIWLILFTLIISTASIVIFNYVSADIKTSNKFFKNIKKSLDLDSYAIAAVELYKQNNQRNDNIFNTGYRYEIIPIDSSKILVNILKSNDLYAKYIMLYSVDLGSINKIVGNPTTFKANNIYNNTLIATTSSYIDVNANKIFNNLIVLPNSNIIKTDGTSINTNEFSKYTNNLITDIDIPNLSQELNQYISDYYRNYYNNLYAKYLDTSMNPKPGTYLYANDDIIFTKEGDLILKKQANVYINNRLSLGPRNTLETYVDIYLPSGDKHYFIAVSKYITVHGKNAESNGYVLDYTTNKDLETNDLDLANTYQNRIDRILNYYPNAIAKVIDLDNKYISVKTPKKEFIILALDNVNLQSFAGLCNNVQVIGAPGKRVTIIAPFIFLYYDYNIQNHSLPVDSNSFIRVIADNIDMDANNSRLINITGAYVTFYNNNSSINVINAPNDVELHVFGTFQTYNGLKINNQDITNTNATEYYYSDPRVEKINNIANLKIYRTQILAREIIKF